MLTTCFSRALRCAAGEDAGREGTAQQPPEQRLHSPQHSASSGPPMLQAVAELRLEPSLSSCGSSQGGEEGQEVCDEGCVRGTCAAACLTRCDAQQCGPEAPVIRRSSSGTCRGGTATVTGQTGGSDRLCRYAHGTTHLLGAFRLGCTWQDHMCGCRNPGPAWKV